MLKVLDLSGELGDRLPFGVFYQNEEVPSYTERNVERMASPFVHNLKFHGDERLKEEIAFKRLPSDSTTAEEEIQA